MFAAALTCIGVGAAIYVVLALLGAPLWLLVRPATPPLSDALVCPLLGLAILQVFSWYWLRYSDHGMVVGLPVLCGCSLVALLVVARRKRIHPRRLSVARCAATLGFALAVTLLFVVEYRVPLGTGRLTAASIWNADIALYSSVSGALVSHGYSWAGHIAGVNLGARATKAAGIGPGVYAMLGSAAAGTGVGAWRTTIPLMLVAVVLVAFAGRDAATLLSGRRAAGFVVGLLVSMASLFVYVTTNYFLAQVLVMALAISEWAVLHWLARLPSSRDRLGGVVLLLAIIVSATLSYSPMAFLMQPVIVAAVCLGEFGRGWSRRAVRVIGPVVGGFVVAFVLVPVPFWRSLRFTSHALDVEKGWPLRLMTPFELLGLGQVIHSPRPRVAVFAFESMLVGLVIVTALLLLWRRERRLALFCAATAGIVLGSYACVYALRGYSYEQWKWISFFQPLFAVAVYTLVLAAVLVFVQALPRARLAPLSVCAGAIVAVLILTSLRTVVSGTRSTRAVWAPGAPRLDWSVVRAPLSDLPHRPEIRSLRSVNVDLSLWDTMWAAYFLQPRMHVYLVAPSYFPRRGPRAPVTLVARPGGDPRAPDSYELVRRALAGNSR